MTETDPVEGTLFGYVDRLSVEPGERIDVLASSSQPELTVDVVRLICGDEHPDGPGAKVEEVDVAGSGVYRAALQRTACGSLIVAPVPTNVAWPSFTVALWLWPTTPTLGCRQGVVAREGHFCLLIDADGALTLEVAGERGPRIAPGPRERRWSRVVASFDAVTRRAALSLTSEAWPPQHAVAEAEVPAPAAPTSAPVLLAASALDPSFPHPAGIELFNGKLEQPQLWDLALMPSELDAVGKGPVAAWNVGSTTREPSATAGDGDTPDPVPDTVPDRSGNDFHATAWNLPSRPATGHAWTGEHQHPDLKPEHYEACHFHEDDLEDCRWTPTATLRLPDDLASGVYAARIRAGKLEDVIPFFVRPRRGTATSPVAVLFPTVSYGAYANERMQDRSFVHEPGVLGREILPDHGDLVLRAHPELGGSLYDSHSDGSGICYSSFRRPVLNMRPGHRNWQTHAPRALSADLYLVDWLRSERIAFDALCDHDLHAEGPNLLEQYRVLITGCHPEYWTNSMLDALETWLDAGGRLMYLGGNGFYWVTSIDPARPHVVEVRRGVCGVRTWESQPGEFHHTSTGELGGLWRNRGRSPNALVGVGFAAQGFDDKAPGYHQLPDARDPRAAFVFEGIDADEEIGDFGLSMGGASSDEIDRYDVRYGSPPETLVLATSQGGHSDYILLVPEDIPVTHLRVGGTTCDDVRADITLMPTANGGAVFSTSSIGWTAAMAVDGYRNNASRMSANVLRRFLDPAPLDLAGVEATEAAVS